MVQKNTAIQPNKPITTENLHLDINEALQIVKANQGEGMDPHNNSLQGEGKAPSVLINLLKNPSVTVNFLKNIMLLQEIIKLIPVKNTSLTEELQQLFNSLMISPKDIVTEMLSQEKSSTVFKGELFDFLRNMSSSANNEAAGAITTFLKAINSFIFKQDTLDSVANNLFFLSNTLSSTSELSQSLAALSQQFKSSSGENFVELKNQTLSLLKDIGTSIFMTPKLEKIISITIYNLSRYNPSEEFLSDAFSNLYTALDGQDNKQLLLKLFHNYLEKPQNNLNQSKVMETISKIISKETASSEITLLNGEKINNIIHSLLSSPCNFTPLLHYIIPVASEAGNSFAEFWIDPDAEEEKKNGEIKEAIHILIVFDIDGIGQFETEIFSRDKRLSINLFCPKGYDSVFSKTIDSIAPIISQKGFALDNVNVGVLEKPRSLMDVFKTLPYKRTGIDVKV
ncbi:MAG: antitoxin [Oscillospiraceae bacterium]